MVYNILRNILDNGFRKQKLLIKEILTIESLQPGKILDLGCGTGTYAGLFDCRDYIGLEINPVYIEYARRHNSRYFVRGDACNLPFKNESFGLICCVAIFHHLPEQQVLDALKETQRVLTPGSLFLVIDQVAKEMNFFIDWFFRLIRYFDKGKFIRTPQENLSLLERILIKGADFSLMRSWSFRSGIITYQGMLLKKK